MRLAVFSDIHGNLEALEAFISHATHQAVDQFVCLGDIIGYGANPNACFDRLSNLTPLQMLLGNHDAAVIWQTSPYEMSPNASKSILWTMDQLATPHSDRIKHLQALLKMDDMVFCHATPNDPTGWHYMTTWIRAVQAFIFCRGRVTFVGHTHCPKVMVLKSGYKVKTSPPPEDGRLNLAVGRRYIINCGSIGQPRDGNPKSAYVIYDTDQELVEFIRIDYDIDGAARRIVDKGLPKYLAQRLYKGR